MTDVINAACMDTGEMTEIDKDDRLSLDGCIDRRMDESQMADIDETRRSFGVTTLLGAYAKELKNYVHRKSDTQVFIAAFFITAQIWEQL